MFDPPVGLVFFGYGSRDMGSVYRLEQMSCSNGYKATADVNKCRSFFNIQNITDNDICFDYTGYNEMAYYDTGSPLFSKREKQVTLLGVGVNRVPKMWEYLGKQMYFQLFASVFDSVNEIRAAMTELDRFRP